MKILKLTVVLLVLLGAGGVIVWQTRIFDPEHRLMRELESGKQTAYKDYILWLGGKKKPDWEARIIDLKIEAAEKGITSYAREVYDLALAGDIEFGSESRFERIHGFLLKTEYGPAIYRQSQLLEEDSPEEAQEYLMEAAAKNHPDAMLKVSQQYLQHEDQGMRFQYGTQYLRKAADAGLAEAQYQIGMRHLEGRSMPKSTKMAYEWLYKAAQQNHPEAMYETGFAYLKSPFSRKEIMEGRRLLEAALDAGVLKARFPLAQQMLKEGEEEALPVLWQEAFEGNEVAVKILQSYDRKVRFPDNKFVSGAWSIALLEENSQEFTGNQSLEWSHRVRASYIAYLCEKRDEWKDMSSGGEELPKEWVTFDPVKEAVAKYEGLESMREDALAGDADAAYSLYQHFRDLNELDEFLYWLRYAGKLHHKEAFWDLYRFYEEREDALDESERTEMDHAFHMATLSGHPDAKMLFAMQLLDDPDRSADTANKALWEAYEAGNDKALRMLKKRVLSGVGVEKVNPEWLPEIQSWADDGEPVAMVILGRGILSEIQVSENRQLFTMYFESVFPEKDLDSNEEKIDKGIDYITRACELGNVQALEHLAWIHVAGNFDFSDFLNNYDDPFGVVGDLLELEMVEDYEMLEGIKPFDPEAAYELIAEWEGSLSRSLRWLKAILTVGLQKEGAEGVLNATKDLYALCEENYLPAKDFFPERDNDWLADEEREYVSIFEVMHYAEQGDPHALTRGAVLLINSLGDDFDEAEDIIEVALDFLDEAADKDFVPALVTLAGLHQQGKVVRHDQLRALRYMELAAEAGNLEAQETVGFAYGTGSVVAKDADKAMRFLSMAADQGSQQAKELIERLALARGVSDSDKGVMDWLVENRGLAGEFFPITPHVVYNGSLYQVDGYKLASLTMKAGDKSYKVPDEAGFLWLAGENFHPAKVEVSDVEIGAEFFITINGKSTPMGEKVAYSFEIETDEKLDNVLMCLVHSYHGKEFREFRTIENLRSGKSKKIKLLVKNRYMNPSFMSFHFFNDGVEMLSNVRAQPMQHQGIGSELVKHIEDNKDGDLPPKATSEWPNLFKLDDDQIRDVPIVLELNKRGAIKSISVDQERKLTKQTRTRLIEEIGKMGFLPALSGGESVEGKLEYQLSLL